MLWTAFILGLVGSLHCAGMCGPLALALPAVGNTRNSFVVGRLVNNSGRLFSYSLIGALFGLAGTAFSLAGFQQSVSIAAGTVILIALFAAHGHFGTVAFRLVGRLKKLFGKLLQKKSYSSLFALGAINGLLPCGLVYVAAIAAAASTSFLHAILYMLAFGLGTLPMMLGIGLGSQTLQRKFGVRSHRLIPIAVATVAVLLIIRGLSLGIPYLSPDLATGPACH